MDEPEIININIDELPANLTIDELRDHLSRTHPDEYVNIFREPLAIFGQLPSELLGHIMTSESKLRPLSSRINKTIKNAAKKRFYEIECQRNITAREVLKDIESDKDDLTIIIDESALCDYEVWAYIYVENENNEIEQSNSMYCILNDNSHEGNHVIIHDGSLDDIEKKDIMTTVDLFTEFRIRSKRINCVEYNKNYAKQWLVNKYNDSNILEFRNPISFGHFKNIFILNYIAFQIGSENVNLLNLSLYLNDENDINILIETFIESRQIIRDKVIFLTGARPSKQDPGFLIL